RSILTARSRRLLASARGSRGARTSAPRSDNAKQAASRNFSHISVGDILAIKNKHSGQQESEDVSATGGGVVVNVGPGNFRFENNAPEIHISSEKVRSQGYEKFDAAYDVKREIDCERRRHRRDRIVANH